MEKKGLFLVICLKKESLNWDKNKIRNIVCHSKPKANKHFGAVSGSFYRDFSEEGVQS